MKTISRITLFSLLSISLSHAMEEKDNVLEVKGNLKGSGEYATFSKKQSLEEEAAEFYTEHTKYALKPIFHILVTGDEPDLNDDLMAGKYGKLKGITVDSESEAHTIMKMRMGEFFNDKKSKLFKTARGTKDFISRGSKLAKDSFHQFFVVKASEQAKDAKEALQLKAFYTSMLMVAASSFNKNAVPLVAKANKEYKKKIEGKISSLEANILILNQKHAGEITALNNLLAAEQNAHLLTQTKLKSCDKARFGWKMGLLAVGTAGAVCYKTGIISINTDKIPFMNNNN